MQSRPATNKEAHKRRAPHHLDAAQLAHLAQVHRGVLTVSITAPDPATGQPLVYTGHWRRADYDIYRTALRAADGDTLKLGEVVLENCFLGGDHDLLDDPTLRMALDMQLGYSDLMPDFAVEVKKSWISSTTPSASASEAEATPVSAGFEPTLPSTGN